MTFQPSHDPNRTTCCHGHVGTLVEMYRKDRTGKRYWTWICQECVRLRQQKIVRLGRCGHRVVNRNATVCRACYMAAMRYPVQALDAYWRELGLAA